MSVENTPPARRRKKSTIVVSTPVEEAPRTVTPEKAPPYGKVIATLAVLAVLGGAYFATQGSGEATRETAESVATRSRGVVEAVPATVASAAVTAVTEAPAAPVVETAATTTISEPPAQPVAPVVEESEIQLIQAAEGATGCLSRLYTDLASLQQAVGNGATWTSHQRFVTKLVQDIINCDGTGFDVLGSLDMVTNDQADLAIQWDSSRNHLTLEMIDVDAAAPVMENAGVSDAVFVLR